MVLLFDICDDCAHVYLALRYLQINIIFSNNYSVLMLCLFHNYRASESVSWLAGSKLKKAFETQIFCGQLSGLAHTLSPAPLKCLSCEGKKFVHCDYSHIKALGELVRGDRVARYQSSQCCGPREVAEISLSHRASGELHFADILEPRFLFISRLSRNEYRVTLGHHEWMLAPTPPFRFMALRIFRRKPSPLWR